MRRTLLLPVGLVALSACGGGGSSVATTIPAGTDLVVKAVPTIRWDKNEYTAAAGSVQIFLANDDNVKHDLVILKDGKTLGDFELKVQKNGDSASGTVDLEPGEYKIYCIVPGHSSMNSTLTVS